jgi:YVTN family beta-propeller protein
VTPIREIERLPRIEGRAKMHSVFRTVFLLAAAITACTAGVLSESTPKSDSNRDLLLVVNKGDQTLGIVDPESGLQLATVPVEGTTGHEVAASPDGRTAWVPIYGNSGVGSPGTDGRTVAVIDLKSHTRIATVDLGHPARPHCAIFGPKNGRLYVTAELTRSIEVIDPNKRKVVDSIPTGEPQSHMLAISSDGKRGYTSNVGAGTVSVIDLPNKRVLAVIPVSAVVQRIAISIDDRWVFTADQTKPQLAVIDTQTNKVKTWVPLPDLGFGMTPTHDGGRLLITQPATDSVLVLNLLSMKVERVIHVPADPQEIVVRPDDRIAYVSCDQSKQVVAINVSSGKIEKVIEVGAGADGLAWAAASPQ